jgi:23S rRNA (uracil1939-C5)-methyltransferase
MSQRINPKHLPVSKGQTFEAVIDEMAFGSKAIIWIETTTGSRVPLFIENAIAGQTHEVILTKIDRRHVEGRSLRLLSPSAQEIPIPYQPIPGAPYATLPYSIQQEFKKKEVVELFKRIGKVEPEESFDTTVTSPELWHFRNKMEYSFSTIGFNRETNQEEDGFFLGFKKKGTWWMVESLKRDSGMFDVQLENAFPRIEKWCLASGLPAWHPPQRHGFYRYLVARKSFKHNQILLNLVTSSQQIENWNPTEFVQLMREILGERLAGVIHTVNDETADRVDPLFGETHVLYGCTTIQEEILGLQFEISMKSFFQTNPRCAEKLYSKALEYVFAEPPVGIILDLFCGTGTITQLLAKQGKGQVVGVDIEPKAIENARVNAANNNVHGVTFLAEDVGEFLKTHAEYQGQIHTLVLDPPRAGITPKTLQKIIALNAQRMVYISCNPATQARDTEVLQQHGYKLCKWSMVDQFPHTAHVETVALFELHLNS